MCENKEKRDVKRERKAESSIGMAATVRQKEDSHVQPSESIIRTNNGSFHKQFSKPDSDSHSKREREREKDERD